MNFPIRQDQKPTGFKAKRGPAKKKKVPEGPVRPLSAYNYFFKNERQVLIETLPVRPEGKPRRSHGRCGFKEMAQIIGSRWKSLTPEERAPFDQIAKADKERYYKEMKEYKKAKRTKSTAQTEESANSRGQDTEEAPSNISISSGTFTPESMQAFNTNSSWSTQQSFFTNNDMTAMTFDPQLFVPIATQYQESPAISPVDAFAMPEQQQPDEYDPYRPVNYEMANFKVEMARLASQLDPYLMNHFIKSFR